MSHGITPAVSIIIPAFNEAARILPTLRGVSSYFKARESRFEIIVVDDGSSDDTAAAVAGFARSTAELRLLCLPGNRGKGAAVRTGMREARGNVLLFADADGATPIQEYARLEQVLQRGADLVIGSRALASRRAEFSVAAHRHRTIIGGLFNRFVRMVAVPGIADTQCGFKLFRRAVARDLFGVARIDGFGFDIELLYVALLRGYRIAEIPVNWADQPGSKVRLLRDGIRTVNELWAIRRNHARACYMPTTVVPAAASPSLFRQKPA